MSDRYKGLTVSLEEEMRQEDLQPIVDAIAQIRGVVDVSTVLASLTG